ncbi:nicotinamide mononucleotide transporter [Micromonospora phaseoli]|uniref:Nicotinamide mononucleotide transporter n=1 Tax=Micromonospora phaseoli TaxID=1144548 RepID=A0A1H6T7X9_9ACTN|nr:nicotinamide riboside transporter PnuC [Micromonospora phaseoli]PZW04139.1 nicotinamide mononucleotide transporter [Micromonospora phaseoli]GIJ79324.1 nicotinamide mononucleotide transporter [Micromonospora phaseoli]SEI72390.1 nicotinamide mononucleotide transporter [Micromonospora phaseoli]
MTGALGWLLTAEIQVAGSPVLVREVVGNVFGLGSALLGLRRLVWAWPVGMVGNALLFTVFLGGAFATPQAHDLYGQAGRQVFFFGVSLYGWWRWTRTRRLGTAADGSAVVPRWATGAERLGLLAAAVVGTALAYPVLAALGSWGPLPDAWILVGSLLATYGMARGWVDFWLIWIAVDAVGVPLLLRGGFYPSAAMYLLYGAFCVWGLASWWRASRAIRSDPAPIPSTYSEATA